MLFKNADRIILNGTTATLRQKRHDALEMLSAGIDAVDPYRVVKQRLHGCHLEVDAESIDFSTFDHVYVVGFGKASVGMARALLDTLPITHGSIITNDSSATLNHPSLDVHVGSHPLPTQENIRATEKLLSLLYKCTDHDGVIVLISGGGSSLLCKPRVSLSDLQLTTKLLLLSGATIQEMNTVRKHISYVKGGQMVQQTKAVVFSLIISDIVGDPLDAIASGPTTPDPTTYADAKTVLETYALWKKIPTRVRTVITDGIAARLPETPKPDDPIFSKVFNYLIANNTLACNAIEKKAKELGYQPTIVTTSLTGEARKMGAYLIDKAQHSLMKEKAVFISGGETTVHVTGTGEGGRNQELVLGSLQHMTESNIVIGSCGTDGIDGNSSAAGAIADSQTLVRAKQKKLSPNNFLQKNNSYEFFSRLKDTLITGPTGTNVMDLQIILR